MIKAIIFDYDGVMVDSFPAVHRVYQIISSRLGKACPHDLASFRKVYGKKSKECMNNLKFTSKEVEKANCMYVEEIQKQVTPFFPGIGEVIRKLCQRYPLFLVSASPSKEVVNKLKKEALDPCFTEIIGGTLGSLEKVPELVKLLKRHHLRGEEVIMIGDRINDYEDAVRAGIKHILLVEYGWGYNKDEIPEHKQKVKVKKPEDLLKAIASIL